MVFNILKFVSRFFSQEIIFFFRFVFATRWYFYIEELQFDLGCGFAKVYYLLQGPQKAQFCPVVLDVKWIGG